MSSKSRRPFRRSRLFNSCLCAALLLAAFVGFAHQTHKAHAEFGAPGFANSNKALKPASDAEMTSKVRLRESYGRLPLSFEANQGQADRAVQFLSRGSGYDLFLTSREAVLRVGMAEQRSTNKRGQGLDPRADKRRPLKSSVLRMKFAGANPAPQVSGRFLLIPHVRCDRRDGRTLPAYPGPRN